jgi:hypothetical protein
MEMMEIPLARPEITKRNVKAMVAVLRTPVLGLGIRGRALLIRHGVT